jgi:hypothetical protein
MMEGFIEIKNRADIKALAKSESANALGAFFVAREDDAECAAPYFADGDAGVGIAIISKKPVWFAIGEDPRSGAARLYAQPVRVGDFYKPIR